jgi:hypothetical protein
MKQRFIVQARAVGAALSDWQTILGKVTRELTSQKAAVEWAAALGPEYAAARVLVLDDKGLEGTVLAKHLSAAQERELVLAKSEPRLRLPDPAPADARLSRIYAGRAQRQDSPRRVLVSDLEPGAGGVLTVAGWEPLERRVEIKGSGADLYDWGHEGPGAWQLAADILADHVLVFPEELELLAEVVSAYRAPSDEGSPSSVDAVSGCATFLSRGRLRSFGRGFDWALQSQDVTTVLTQIVFGVTRNPMSEDMQSATPQRRLLEAIAEAFTAELYARLPAVWIPDDDVPPPKGRDPFVTSDGMMSAALARSTFASALAELGGRERRLKALDLPTLAESALRVSTHRIVLDMAMVGQAVLGVLGESA